MNTGTDTKKTAAANTSQVRLAITFECCAEVAGNACSLGKAIAVLFSAGSGWIEGAAVG